MGCLSKGLASILIMVVTFSCLSLLMVKPANAQKGVTTPSNPDFGVSYRFLPHSIPPVYDVDPSTGKAVMTKEGYTEYSESAYLSIMNQPFEPYEDSNGNSIQLFYGIRWKEPSNNSWVYLPSFCRLTQNSEGDRVLINFDFKGSYQGTSWGVLDIPMGTETEFQVQALIGYYSSGNVFVGKTSDWTTSDGSQHATLPSNLSSPNTSSTSSIPNATQSVPEFTALAILALLLSVFSVAMIVGQRRVQSRKFDLT